MFQQIKFILITVNYYKLVPNLKLIIQNNWIYGDNQNKN